MEIGSKVEHILSRDWLLILKVAKDENGQTKMLCRTKDLREIWFFSFELVVV